MVNHQLPELAKFRPFVTLYATDGVEVNVSCRSFQALNEAEQFIFSTLSYGNSDDTRFLVWFFTRHDFGYLVRLLRIAQTDPALASFIAWTSEKASFRWPEFAAHPFAVRYWERSKTFEELVRIAESTLEQPRPLDPHGVNPGDKGTSSRKGVDRG